MAAKSECLGSDILTPSKCGPCLIENITNEATMFCVECNDMLCDSCVGIHKRFPTMKNHKIVVQTDKEQFEFTAQLLSDKCDKHDGKHLETFCKIHDELCCSVCISLNHRMCDGLVYLPEFASERTEKEKLKGRIRAIEQIKTRFENAKKSRQADKIRMGKEKADSSKKMDDCRKELIKEIDRIHGNFNAKLKSRYDKNVALIDEDVKICDDGITDLNKVLQSLNNVENDEVRSFVGARRAEGMIKVTEEKLGCILGNVGKDSMVFRLESNLKNKIQGIDCFGEFEMQKESQQKKEKETFPYKITIGKSVSQCQLADEVNICSVMGLGLMKNGQIIISDRNNKNLKMFNQKLAEVQKVSLPGSPRDVCMIDDDICISYQQERKVEIASLSGASLQTRNTIEIGKRCRGVCYKNSELFVACGENNTAEVRVYSLEGKLKRTFDRDAKGNKLFSAPYYVNTNNEGSLVFIGDNQNGVLALKVDGTLVWKYNDKKVLKEVWDIAVDENDDLYVCGNDSNNIMKISSNGQNTEVVLDGVVRPRAICYDGFNERVIVPCTGSRNNYSANILEIYQINKQRM